MDAAANFLKILMEIVISIDIQVWLTPSAIYLLYFIFLFMIDVEYLKSIKGNLDM